MRLFGKRRGRGGQVRQADSADTKHLEAFARDRTGVEAFVEPPNDRLRDHRRVRRQHR